MKNQLYRLINCAMLIATFLPFASCKTSAQKLVVSPIIVQPKRIFTETESDHTSCQRSGFEEITARYIPAISLLNRNGNSLELRIQGNIGSAGLHIHKVRKIRCEEEVSGEMLLLKYTVEIQKKAGKESAAIRGYNYEQAANYTILEGVKLVKVMLYEDYIGNTFIAYPTLVFEDTFNLNESD